MNSLRKEHVKQERMNLRLPPQMIEAVDAALAQRVGRVSRNTWITEAVQEKLIRDGLIDPRQPELWGVKDA